MVFLNPLFQIGDGILPSQDLDQDVTYPNRPRTRSQAKKIDVYVGGESDPNQTQLNPKMKSNKIKIMEAGCKWNRKPRTN